VRLTQQNIDFFNLQVRVEVREGDFLQPFASERFFKKVDLLTCNPPYISTTKVTEMNSEISDHEPDLAFDGGPFGIKILRKLIKEAPDYLKSGGWLVFEVGLGQGEKMIQRMEKKYNYSLVRPVFDENENIRVIMAQM
jgi:release factor glutamine methyltransferase